MKKIILYIGIVILSEALAFSQVIDNNLIKAGMLSNSKNFEEAYSAIKQSTATANKNYDKILADIYFGLKKYPEALNLYTNLEKEAPGNYQVELARTFAMTGNMAKAIEHLNSYFSQKNKIPISKLNNDPAFASFRNNNAQWNNILQKADYSEAEIKVNQVNTAAESGNFEYVNSLVNEALKKFPANSELLFQQSRYFFENKMYDAALKSINEAIAHKATDDKYFYQKTQIELKNNNAKDALESINKAINRNPFEVKYYITRIDVNRSLGNTQKVNEEIEFIDYCLPNNKEVQFAKILAEADKGNYMNAIDGLNTLISKDGSNKDYYLLRGKMDLKVQKLVDADEDFGMALDLNPNDAEANFEKGLAKFQMDDKDAACYYWQKASNLGNREASEYLNKYCRN